MIRFILAHMGEGKKRGKLQELLLSGMFKVSFMKYNWDLNSKHWDAKTENHADGNLCILWLTKLWQDHIRMVFSFIDLRIV